MNCPSCKNPVKKNDSICEWCGEIIEVSNPESSDSKNHNTESFDGIQILVRYRGLWSAFGEFHVLVDGLLVGIGSSRKGFEISFNINNQYPQIIIKSTPIPWKKKIELPDNFVFEIGNKYLINLIATHWNIFSLKSIPKITKID
jgi:hypothetical protein